jgi:hypothetical protein
MVDRLGHRPSPEDRCPRWVGRGPDHQGHWARSACRTPRVGELRPFRPVSLKQRSFGSQQPELVGLQPEGSLPSDSTDRPAKGPTLQSPRRQSCRDLGADVTSTPKPTAYLRHCDRLSIGAAAARCGHRNTRHTCARVVKPTRHMDSTGRLRDRAPNTQHQPSVYFPTFRSLNDQGMVHHRNFQRDGAVTGRARRPPG